MVVVSPMQSISSPFADAVAITPLGDSRYGAELGLSWTVGTKVPGGLLLVLLARAGLAQLRDDAGEPEPLAVTADFLRAPDPGPVTLHTEVLERGRTVSLASVRMEQYSRLMLAATITAAGPGRGANPRAHCSPSSRAAPVVFNVDGRFGWAPTVQLTALLRAHPAAGWLRLESRATVVAGAWFDEDVTVIDSAGRLICQARQLALAPLASG